MKSLNSIWSEMHPFGHSDIAIICEYLRQPEVIGQAPEILSRLMQGEINKYVQFKNYQEIWQSIPCSYYYRDYPLEVAEKLDSMTRRNILGKPLTEGDIEWLTNYAQSIKLESAFFVPLLEEIHQNGIYFKGEKHKNVG